MKTRFLFLAACLSVSAFAAESGMDGAAQYDQWVLQGQSLSAKQAARLEEALLEDPSSAGPGRAGLRAARRAKLLGYYFIQPGPSQGYHPGFKRHFTWWIGSDPRSPVFESPHLVFWGKDRDLTEAWLRVLEKQGEDEAVARHAAAYFLLSDPRKSGFICETAVQAGGKGLEFYAEAGPVLGRNPSSKAEFRRIFAYVEKAYQYSAKCPWPDNQPNFNMLTYLAKGSGDAAKTRKYQELWDRAEELE